MLTLPGKMLAFAAALAVVALPVQSRAETITVTHWGSAFYGAPYAVAIEKGFFKKYGVDITGVLTSQGGGTSVLPWQVISPMARWRCQRQLRRLRTAYHSASSAPGRKVLPTFYGWPKGVRRSVRLTTLLARRSPLLRPAQ